ncbi:MAG: 5'-3' exonuclease [Candidatus Dormibacteraeota bacterium]|nr:5'-3' exonuclease [Candidatus Dormibacteraeota bacterium]
MPDWLLVDGSSMIFRAFYGVPQSMRAPDGRPVNAVRGFLDSLARMVSERRPRFVGVASDEDWRPEWRVELVPSYKSHRTAEPVPPLLEPQFPVIHDALRAAGVDFVGSPGYEAEDVIATWVALAEGAAIDIVSGDRDLFAVARDPLVRVLYPEKGGMAEITEAEVERRYGVPGRLYADYAVLRGDPSDGLPGLPGVGPKRAADIIRLHGGLRGLIEAGRLRAADQDYLERAQRVVTPVRDVPVELPAGRRPDYPVDGAALEELSRRHGLKGSVERLITALRLTR